MCALYPGSEMPNLVETVLALNFTTMVFYVVDVLVLRCFAVWCSVLQYNDANQSEPNLFSGHVCLDALGCSCVGVGTCMSNSVLVCVHVYVCVIITLMRWASDCLLYTPSCTEWVAALSDQRDQSTAMRWRSNHSCMPHMAYRTTDDTHNRWCCSHMCHCRLRWNAAAPRTHFRENCSSVLPCV